MPFFRGPEDSHPQLPKSPDSLNIQCPVPKQIAEAKKQISPAGKELVLPSALLLFQVMQGYWSLQPKTLSSKP